MIDSAVLLPYLLACVLFTIVPGPSVTLVIANTLSGGMRAGTMTLLGTEVAMALMVLVVAFGLSAVMALVAEAFLIIKLVGAVYLIWIGWRMVTSRGGLSLTGQESMGRGDLHYLVQGTLVNLSNPKTLLFLGAFLPQFIDTSRDTFGQIILLGGIVMAIATLTDLVYASIAGRARLALDAARIRLMNRLAGAILMIGGIWLALQKRG